MTLEHQGATRISGSDACGSILLVGETNPYGADARYALYHEPTNAAGHRLQSKILGVRPREHYLSIWRTNLCTGGWDPDDAAFRADELVRSERSPWSTIVVLGRKVAKAFTRVAILPGYDPVAFEVFSTKKLDGGALRLVYLPHPSGRNTLWNAPANVQRARDVMRRVAPGIPWGEVDAAAA